MHVTPYDLLQTALDSFQRHLATAHNSSVNKRKIPSVLNMSAEGKFFHKFATQD